MQFPSMTSGLALLILSHALVQAMPVASPNSLAIRQNAGTGAGCDSIASDADTATGEGIENAEDNLAGTISSVKSTTKFRRQNAGTGAACNSIFSDSDTSTGEGIENAEDNVASTITTVKSSTKRQENRIADGASSVLDAAGANTLGGTVKQVGDSTDGDETNDLATAGAEVGQLELDTIPAAGSAARRMRRQENRIADGASSVLDAAGANTLGGTVKEVGDNTDGDETNDLATTGAEVGQLELDTIPAVGSAA